MPTPYKAQLSEARGLALKGRKSEALTIARRVYARLKNNPLHDQHSAARALVERWERETATPEAIASEMNALTSKPMSQNQVARYRQLSEAMEAFTPNSDPCGCADRGCPKHAGIGTCDARATITLFRVDMVDVSGTRFCEACADDALTCGAFHDAPSLSDVEHITEQPTPELQAERATMAHRLPFSHAEHARAVLAAETAVPVHHLSEAGLRYRIGAMRAIVTGANALNTPTNDAGMPVILAATRAHDEASRWLASYPETPAQR